MRKKIKALEVRRGELLAASQAILAAADERELSPEEDATLTANKAELENIRAKSDQYRALMEEGEPLPTSLDWPGMPAQATHVGNAREALESDPKRGFKTSQEFFKSVMNAGLNGRLEDNRLKFLATAGSDEAGKYSDPYGGFLVPSGFLPNLLSVQAETDPTAGRTTQIPMATGKVSIPARSDKTHTSSVSGGLAVYRRSETQTVTASRMVVEQVELNATPLMGLSYATEELIRDSAISFVALIEAGFRDEFAARILKEKISGTGAGCMEGVLNAACTLSVTAETSQDADSIVYENVINMRSRCWGYQNAIWLYNHDCLPQLMQLVMVIGTSGVPMWQTSAREGEPDMLLGRPAYPTEYCPTVGDAGDLLLGNWSQYLEGTRTPLQTAESLHVRFEYNERTFRFLMENDGRCWWRTYLTPAKSSTTLSPFVVIAARA